MSDERHPYGWRFIFGRSYLNSAPKTLQLAVGLMLVAFAIWALWPGLYGNFYLDDFPNLSPLENAGSGGSPLLSYLLNPAVSGLGRPVAYLTFLLQKDAWPNDPFAFKVVNLAIHVANAFAVFLIALLSTRLFLGPHSGSQRSIYLAFGCALVWLILPIHSSSVFYVVQRMTLLSATFSLIGIAGYLWIRHRFPVWTLRQYLWAGAFVLFGFAGVLAKENSIQTGLLIWAFELTILARLSWRPSKAFVWLLLIGPFLLLILYLFTVNDVLSGYAHREFTLKERLLTQAVIFWEYFSKVTFPTPERLHLFNDGGQVYAGLFSSLKVAFSVFSLLVLSLASVIWRKRYPWLAFAFLFFCFGHILESTFIPLELNFEHRNYLPSVGLVIGIVCFIFLNLRPFVWGWKKRMLFVAALSAWAVLISGVAMLEARTWGSSKSFALSSLLDRQGSYRARQEAAAFFIGSGEYLTAANLLYSIENDFGVYAGTYAQLILLKCYDDTVPLPPKKKIEKIFATAPVDNGAEVAIRDIWQIKRSAIEACPHVTWDQLIDYIQALIKNENFSRSLNLHLLLSFINADRGAYGASIEILENLPPSQKDTAVKILIIRFLVMAGEQEAAYSKIEEVLDSATQVEVAVYGDYLRTLRNRIKAPEGASQ